MIYFACLLLSMLGFYLIENFFTIQPDVTSGNGNPAFFIIIPFFPVFIYGYFLTFTFVREYTSKYLQTYTKILLLVLFSIFCIALIFLIVNNAKELIFTLGGPPTEPESTIFRFGWFNQYTNSMFFNFYTFLLSHLSVVIAAIITSFIIGNYFKTNADEIT